MILKKTEEDEVSARRKDDDIEIIEEDIYESWLLCHVCLPLVIVKPI